MDRTEWVRAMCIEYYEVEDTAELVSYPSFVWELFYNDVIVATIEEDTLYSTIFGISSNVKLLIDSYGLHGTLNLIRNRIFYHVDCMMNGTGAYNNGGRV